MRSIRDGDTHMLTLAGELDVSAGPDVERELRRVEFTCARVIAVDIRELTFIDSSGIRLFLQAQGGPFRATTVCNEAVQGCSRSAASPHAEVRRSSSVTRGAPVAVQ